MPPTGPWAVGGQDGQAGIRCRPLHVIPLPGCTGPFGCWFCCDAVLRCVGRAQVQGPSHAALGSGALLGPQTSGAPNRPRSSVQHDRRWEWAQSWANPRASVRAQSCWEGSEVPSPGPAPRLGASTICSDGAEVGQGNGGGTAQAWLCPSPCGWPAWPGSAEQG